MREQGAFDFTAPSSGRTPLSRATSKAGALSAEERLGRQCLTLLTLYKRHGPLTDRDAALLMDVERNVVNARRATLVKLGLVQAIDKVDGTKGLPNVRWGVQ